MKIINIRANPISVPVPKEQQVTLGIGSMIKRDAVVVKVTTENGITGYVEAHRGRCPGSVAHLVNTTLGHEGKCLRRGVNPWLFLWGR
jgi:L-alanine-DL-glutamate epimerase-like enolase superfamily enzyme